MARNLIPLKKIGNMFDEQVQDLVKRTTLLWASELQTRQPPNLGTPVSPDPGGGVLRQNWTVNVSEPYTGRIINNMEYARPVMYGKDMPPSWQGKWRTRVNAKKGFPDLLGKELSRKHVPRLMRVITQGR
jgi:hypothetical protein